MLLSLGLIKIEYEKGVRPSGKVFNILKVMSQSPQALQSFMGLYLAVMKEISELSRSQREMLAVVISQTNHCYY
ncbi:MAG: carboxymuconolactone decarboxylase family protein [Candidatus Marinimicrobia bacterium]|nr:carboxymuconolactone decarboxylase family protein [Candidatus Neomarinimicrobiota bacterium]